MCVGIDVSIRVSRMYTKNLNNCAFFKFAIYLTHIDKHTQCMRLCVVHEPRLCAPLRVINMQFSCMNV